MKTEDYHYITIPKGTRVVIVNPKADGDIPETLYDVVIEFSEDVAASLMGGRYEFSIVNYVDQRTN